MTTENVRVFSGPAQGGHSSLVKRLFAKKSLISIDKEAAETNYRRALNWWDLTALGIAAIIGSGIFVLTGKVAHSVAGPSVIISFIISGIVSALAALCYAEMASMVNISGSAYSYTYVTLGEFIAWILGWDLILEYLVGSAAVAVGWSYYFSSFVADVSNNPFAFDPRWVNAPVFWSTTPVPGFYANPVTLADGTTANAIMNVPAAVLTILLTIILCLGIRQSAWVINFFVALKLLVVLLFIFAGIAYVRPQNWSPFIPTYDPVQDTFGNPGIFKAALTVFFAYIGFDAVSTTAQEAKNPQRDLPIGILLSLGICTVLYIVVCIILTGIVPYTEIPITSPVSGAMKIAGAPQWIVVTIELGAIFGLASVMAALMTGQPRIFQAMANDGLLPKVIAHINPKTQTPVVAIIICGVIVAAASAVLPVDVLADLTSVGTLLAFFVVSVSVWILRWTDRDRPRRFSIPGGFIIGGNIIPGLSAIASLALIWVGGSTTITIRVFAWMGIGLFLVYLTFGFWKSKARFPVAAEVQADEVDGKL